MYSKISFVFTFFTRFKESLLAIVTIFQLLSYVKVSTFRIETPIIRKATIIYHFGILLS